MLADLLGLVVIGGIIKAVVDGNRNSSGSSSNSAKSTLETTYKTNNIPTSTPKSKPSYKRYSKVAGVTFYNRQNYVKNCNAGDVLTLQREKNNAYDRNAIAVYHKGKQIGYIAKELASELAPKIDAGTQYRCYVEQRTGGGSYAYGVNIRIEA